jgi:glycosyltransferase involved in cell wall biosynthesis
MTERTRVLFVNSGILGQATFSKFVREAMTLEAGIEPSHMNLSEGLTVRERVLRRALCGRFWRDGWLGVNNLDFIRFRAEYHAGVQAARRMRRLFRGGLPDVIHFHRQATAYASVSLMRRVPCLVSIDCTQDIVVAAAASPIERWTYQPNIRAEARIFQAAAAVIATSRWAADCVRRSYPSSRAPIHVMPTPVRQQFFPESWLDERRARAAAGARPRVLFVGGDFARKGGPDLIAAWRAGDFSRSADLEIVTDDSAAREDMPGVRVRRGVDSYSGGWAEAWRRADLFVMPTHQDAFGLVFQEAAAAGLARIGTRVNAVPEIITDGASGLLVTPGDRDGLIRALRTLLQSPELRHRLGCAGRQQVMRDAHPDDYRRRLSHIIHEAARQPPASQVA